MKEMPSEWNDEWYIHKEIKVDPKQTTMRLDKFVTDRLLRTSRNRVQNAIKAGAIKVNKQHVKANYKIRPNDEIVVVLPKPPGDDVGIVPQNIPLSIVFEDDDLMVINKPAGMVVHPGIGHYKNTLVNALAYHLQNEDLPVLKGNQSNRAGLVHRIDKNTSGLMVIAKSDYAMTHLAKQFYNHSIERKYIALAWGDLEQKEGTIVANVGRDPRNRTKQTTFTEEDQGKWAVTHYRVLENFYYVTLVECQLETGRTHQIRVHMKHLGHPLFSDEKYDGRRILKGTPHPRYNQFIEHCFEILPRHALHAKVLGFEHPITKEQLYFESELPDDFRQVMQLWREYVSERKQALR